MCPGAVTILFLYEPTGYTSSIMMRFLTQNKTSIIAAVVLAIVLYGYFAFFRGPSATDILVLEDTPASEASQTLLATINSLNTIKLDDSIFSDPVFLSLTNFGVQIPAEPVGRRNPFAPVGSQ